MNNLLFGIGFLFVFKLVAFADTRVFLDFSSVEGSSCAKSTVKSTLSQSLAIINVHVLSKQTTSLLPKSSMTQPSWLEVEFDLDATPSTFDPDQDVYELCQPEYFVIDERARTQGSDAHSLTSALDQSTYYFQIEVPEELVGRTLCVRAHLAPPPYGPIVSTGNPIERNFDSRAIETPCSAADTNRIGESMVITAFYKEDIARGILVTDSLLDQGWKSERGLRKAYLAAKNWERYESALTYLDIFYQNFGFFGAKRDPSQTLGSVALDVRADSLYQAERSYLVEAIRLQEK